MYYGFDMGGTKIELGIFDAHLRCIWQRRVFAAMGKPLPCRLPATLLRVAELPRIEQACYGEAGGVRGAAFLNLVHGHQ